MSYYDPRNQPPHRLTVSQIKQIEASLRKLEREVAQWKEIARKCEATAEEEHHRMTQLEERLQEQQNTALQAREQAAEWQAKAEQLQPASLEREEALPAAEGKVAQMEDRLARAQADYDNSKKRLERRFAIQADQKIMEFLRDLLPVMDNLDRTIQHAPTGTNNEETLDGVKITRQLFLSALDSYGVQPIDALKQPFDPAYHEAVGTVNDPALPPGTVVEVEQSGYTYREKLLQPARVLITPIG